MIASIYRNLFLVSDNAPSMCRCTLTLEYESKALARTVLEAVKVDNGEFMVAQLEGRKIIASCRAASPLALRHTLDDFLSCAQLAEKSAHAVKDE